jgi:hypothetical protein
MKGHETPDRVAVVGDGDPWVELLDEGRVREAGAARARERWLRTAAAEDVSLAGALLDLAEAATPVVVATSAGRVHSAVVAAVGADVVVLRPPTGALVLVPLGAVTWVRPVEGALPGGGRAVPSGPWLVDLLGRVADRGDRVALWVAGGGTLSGRLAGVGIDVVRLEPDGPDAAPSYVSVPSIREVAVFRSG